MHHPTDRITHTTAFVTPVVEHWLEREIAQWVHLMKDRSNDPSHHERTLLPAKQRITPTGIVITERQFQVGPIYYTEGMVRWYSKHWYLVREKLAGKEGPKTSKTANILH